MLTHFRPSPLPRWSGTDLVCGGLPSRVDWFAWLAMLSRSGKLKLSAKQLQTLAYWWFGLVWGFAPKLTPNREGTA